MTSFGEDIETTLGADLKQRAAAVRQYELTDVGNGDRFAHRNGDEVVWIAPWKSWLVWDGARWVKDDGNLKAMQRAKETARSVYDDVDLVTVELRDAAGDDELAKQLKKRGKDLLEWAHRCQSEPKLQAMLNMAKSVDGMALTTDWLDSDRDILNTQNGVVDLKTGTLGPHNPHRYCTKITRAAYDPDMPTPRWDAFLEAVSCGDADWVRYLQRLVGLALSANPGERVLPICCGEGGNGKTTLFTALLEALGDYASAGNEEAILGRHHGGPQEEIANLFGKRLVILAELPPGQLNVSRVKRLTGGDRISTHRKHEHIFEFDPTFTFFVYTNQPPRVPESGQAIWDRLVLIPFLHKFEGPGLLKKAEADAALAAEGDGILAWCVRGAVDYYQHGLGEKPPCVVKATTDYHADEDTVGQFLEEHTTPAGPDTHVLVAHVYTKYLEWCDENGIKKPIGNNVFGREVRSHGITNEPRKQGKRVYWGLRLKGAGE